MKGSVFRGLLLGCITMVLAAFSFAMPSVATERIGPIYELRISDPSDFTIAPLPAAITVERQAIEAPDARSSVEPDPLSPIYRFSMLTDGQSLSAYHMRC